MKINEDTVAVITGGADGIGFSLAELFIQRGASIALIDNRKDALDEAKRKLDVSFSFFLFG